MADRHGLPHQGGERIAKKNDTVFLLCTLA